MKETNKSKINKLTDEILYITQKLNKLQKQLDIVNDDYIVAVECCEQKWDSKKLLSKHKTTKKCKASNGSDFFSCPRCNIKFFDGYSSLEALEFRSNTCPSEYFSSSYYKHTNSCPDHCTICDKKYKTQYMAKTHKCEIVPEYIPPVIEEEDSSVYCPVKETWDTWLQDGINYRHNKKTNKVYRHNIYVGYIKYQALVFDDDDDSDESSNDVEEALEDIKDFYNEIIKLDDVSRIIDDSNYLGCITKNHIRGLKWGGDLYDHNTKTNKIYDCFGVEFGIIKDGNLILKNEINGENITKII